MTAELSPDFLAREHTVAHAVATFLARSGVRRIYGLTGSHIKPLWEESTRAGIRVVDVRHEAAAVHMAQADAALTGELAVATVTTGPGLTNAVSGIAAAHQAGVPVLVLSAVPNRDQLGLGALEELDQAELVRPITRLARTVMNDRQLLPFLQAAVAAAVGEDGPAGPSYLDFPVDVLRGSSRWTTAVEIRGASLVPNPIEPDLASLEAAAEVLRSSRRPVVITGRGAAGSGEALERFLDATGALYLDTTESRGLVAPDHPSYVPATRSAAMAEADVVVTVGRKLDFALGYGSTAVFRNQPRIIRIGRTFEVLAENRAADVQVKGDAGRVLTALTKQDPTPREADAAWSQQVRADNARRRDAWATRAKDSTTPDGAIHPNALIAVLNETLADLDPLLIADGGDILSFARVGLEPPAQLDTGTFGCLGVGVPYAVAASVVHPDRTVVALVGDGAFGFHGMELDTARRTGATPVIVVANNQAWGIERRDHVENYAANPLFNTALPDCRYDGVAAALGLHSQLVTRLEDLAPALRTALANAPALVEVRTSGEVASPDFAGGLADLCDLHVLRAWSEAEEAALHDRTD